MEENKEINLSEVASIMGKKGGRNSVRKRFAGLSTRERSEYMQKVRRGAKINKTHAKKSQDNK